MFLELQFFFSIFTFCVKNFIDDKSVSLFEIVVLLGIKAVIANKNNIELEEQDYN